MVDYVRVDEQGAADGLAAWDGAAGALSKAFTSNAEHVVSTLKGGAWIGNDSSGEEFKKQFKVSDVTDMFGPGQTGAKIVDMVGDLGKNTRKAIEASLESDKQQGQEMKKPQDLL